ncbi:DUF262 domain-containing protein [Aminipila sp.]|uniref:DUF262 domain-containing protein n=1 Tax=Aminipila sp. TaxID=2060095 RepID=UPI00289A8A10|nr:DUF262 domain-containing protein [Aminipila sp.]
MAIDKKTIGKLKGLRFFVPSYQRGYRWTEFEVSALLDDVSEFSIEGDKRYCIQPLIVKKREDGSFEVVDGQQRLTTIYIFMKIAAQEIRSAVPPFDLNYETRKNSGSFLKTLSDEKNFDDSNIDFYYMGRAYSNMNKWLESQPDKSVAIQELNTKIRKSVFFIWYELPHNIDPIAMFTKVNLGKIPLTNAELIKALILNQDNFGIDARKRQTEISIAWDRIEQGLRDDSFWYFLCEKEQSGTRIDMLFDLLAKDYNAIAQNPISTSQNYFPFLVFSAALKNAKGKEEFVNALWSDVEKLYSEFRDWYNDLNKYHTIGYLIANGTKITEIFSLTRGKRKCEVATALLAKAKIKYDDLNILALDTTAHKKRIRQLLLLFNIATLVCKSEKQYRFPFDIYKREQWDIEHIHATADETDDADDSLGNLALLDCHTNRSYKEAQFVDKRKIIIERESKGLFVPLCTKNVFLKVYSKNLNGMDSWNEKDKTEYVSAIKQTLDTFFNGRSEQ